MAQSLLASSLVSARVSHVRLRPRRHGLSYDVHYVALPLRALEASALDDLMAVNHRWSLYSFHLRDHGGRDGGSLLAWVRGVFRHHGLTAPAHVVLLAHPRVLGFVFNPVSFWLCFDDAHLLRGVICEVNNTFGETHSYLCVHDDMRPIAADDWLCAHKCFHVSPFLAREGAYHFRFAITSKKCVIQIDYFDKKGRRMLVTSLKGGFAPLTRRALRRAFWRAPWAGVRVLALIHYQALRLKLKGIRYRTKPPLRKEKTTKTTTKIK